MTAESPLSLARRALAEELREECRSGCTSEFAPSNWKPCPICRAAAALIASQEEVEKAVLERDEARLMARELLGKRDQMKVTPLAPGALTTVTSGHELMPKLTDDQVAKQHSDALALRERLDRGRP